MYACIIATQSGIKGFDMPSTMRLTDWEQEELRKKCTEFNKLLIKEGREPLKDSELAHALLKIAIKHCRLNRKNEVYIEDQG